MAKLNKRKTAAQPAVPLDMPDDEKWRLINESGILKNMPNGPLITLQPGETMPAEWKKPESETPFADEVFNALLLITPMSFCLLAMEILIHQQYGKQPTFKALADRMLPSVPTLSVFIFYTHRHKANRRMQSFLFFLSCLVGSRLLWTINRANWIVNMRQCPPLATIWVYTIVQLDLGPAVLALVVVAGFSWWKKLSVGFKFK